MPRRSTTSDSLLQQIVTVGDTLKALRVSLDQAGENELARIVDMAHRELRSQSVTGELQQRPGVSNVGNLRP